MADDIVFELLHSEIINYALEKSDNNNKKVVCDRLLSFMKSYQH